MTMTAPVSASGSAAAPTVPRLVLLAAGMFAIGTDSFVIAPLLSHIAHDLDVGIATAAQLITAYALAYALGSPFIAAVTARWPRRRALATGLTIFVLANVGAAFAPSFAALLVARALAGFGAALFAPVASATATGLVTAERRGRALSIMMIGLSGATALGSPLGTLVGSVLSWRAVFLLVAALAATVAVVIVLTIRDGVEADGTSVSERLRPLRMTSVLVTLLTTFLVLTGLYVSYTYISVIFDRATGNDGVGMAILQSIWGFSGVVGATIAGRLTDRLGSGMMVRLMLVFLILDFALMPWASASAGSAAAAMLVWGDLRVGLCRAPAASAGRHCPAVGIDSLGALYDGCLWRDVRLGDCRRAGLAGDRPASTALGRSRADPVGAHRRRMCAPAAQTRVHGRARSVKHTGSPHGRGTIDISFSKNDNRINGNRIYLNYSARRRTNACGPALAALAQTSLGGRHGSVEAIFSHDHPRGRRR